MKIYFKDDPVKQEMLENLVEDVKSAMVNWENNWEDDREWDREEGVEDIEDNWLEECHNACLKLNHIKVSLIEKATGDKIEEVLK